MTSVDYTGRTIDLLIFQGTAVQGDQAILLDLVGPGNNGGEVTTGIQKLVQSFTMLFLTERGSIKYHPELGTTFLTDMRFQRIHDEADVQSSFNLAVELIRTTLSLVAEQTSLPEDEQFASAVLQSFNLDSTNGKLTLFVKIESVAGDSRTIYLPVPVAIQ